MSDTVTNVEIEDVLSSIRRLVSVDHGGQKRSPEAPETPEPSKESNKLVLTDELRIQPQPELVSQEQLKDMAEDYTATLQRRIAELEAAVTAQSTEFEPDGSEDTTQHRPTSVLFRPKARSDNDGVLQLETLVRDGDPDMAKTAQTAETPTPETDAKDAGAPLTDEQAVPNEAPPPEPQAAEPDMPPAQPAPPEEAEVAHEEMWSDAPREPQSHSQTDENVEVIDAERHRKDFEYVPNDEFVFSNDDALIDEETLRDMVAEIVREELQGALGERITHNVRKLVRREIMRAISIRDFE